MTDTPAVPQKKAKKSRERDLTEGSIVEHYKALAIPASIGMLFSTLYNVVDNFFAGLISTTAQAGLSLSFPVFLIIIAFSIGGSQALNGLVGNARGRKNAEEARRVAAQGLGFIFLLSVAVGIFGIFTIPTLLGFIGGQGEYLEAATSYLTIVFFATPTFLLAFAANGILSSQGDNVSHKQSGMVSFFVNCALNPALIYGFAGLPALGFTGIAVSTALIQFGSACFMLYRAGTSSVLRGVQWKEFIPTGKTVREVCAQGLPPALNFMTIAVGFFIWQYYLQPLGEETVAAYGIALRVEQLILLPSIGLTMAMLPILAQNFGAERIDRLRYAFWWGLSVGLGYMVVAGTLLLVGRSLIISFFTADEAVIAVGSSYLIYAALAQPVYMGLSAILTLMQGIKRPALSIVIGLFRQILAALAFTTLFVTILDWGAEGVWISVLMACTSGLILAIFIVRSLVRKTIDHLGSPYKVLKQMPS
ncbi:MATE family efflux transporter [Kiloniella sp. b19]|uniref:MATE family efflux transporter n=1 Tax=Kiloniella sp. GXU_MW_B19 TaxID=3141326 RepID=UPI0031D6216D